MMYKEVLLVLCATAAVRTREFNLSVYIRNVSQKICPFTNYCSTKANDILKNDKNSPCCSECSCDSYSCYKTDNCCPDLEPSPDTSSDLICSDSMTKFTNKRSSRVHNGYKYGVKQYFIVASCPQDYNDSHVVSKCKGSNKTELGDFLWVSHTKKRLNLSKSLLCKMPWPERLANMEFENQLFHATDGHWFPKSNNNASIG